jgi:HmuY protein
MKRIFLCVCFVTACSSSSASSTGAVDAGPDSTFTGAACSAARAQLLGSVDSVSTAAVTNLSSASGVTTFYVDATAGGVDVEANNPWVYVDLGAVAKAQVTDVTSITADNWDLAFKRPLIYTNDGDGGPGLGGSVLIAKDFDSVTAADAASATFATEKFFDNQCNASVDQTGSVLTSMSAWYDYDSSTHQLTPAAGTWLVHGGTGALYKLQIENYYSSPTGGPTALGAGATYLLKVAAL